MINFEQPTNENPFGKIVVTIDHYDRSLFQEPFTFQVINDVDKNIRWQLNDMKEGWWGTFVEPCNTEAIVKDSNGKILYNWKWETDKHGDISHKVFLEWCKANKGAKGIAIGTHDGTTGEWVVPVFENLIEANLVEASDKQYNNLFLNYKNIANTIQSLITSDGSEIEFFEGDDTFTNSVSKEHTLKFNNEVRSVLKKSISINDLIIKCGLQNDLKWLHIDVEGIDDELILSLDDTKVKLPEIIIYESLNLTEERQKKVIEWLKSKNYTCEESGWNTIATLNKKILIQIDTYPNSKDKIEITKLCIESLKPLGYPILLSSHIEIPEELSSLCDYSYSDGLNILLPSTGDVNYFNYYNSNIQMNFKIHDIDSHSPAVITSWINGSNFCKENGFDYFLKVEYDFIVDGDLDKLRNSIKSSTRKNGFVLLNESYVVPKCLFMKADIVTDLIPFEIKTPEDYYKFCNFFDVPVEIRRMAGISKYYALKKHLDTMNIYPSENENYFNCSVPQNLQRSFPGFFAPLIGSDEHIYLCSYGMTSEKICTYSLSLGDIEVSSGDVNFLNGYFSYRRIDLSLPGEYKLSWINGEDKSDLLFTHEDVINGKYGTIEIKN